MKKITLFIFLLIFSLGHSQDPATGPTNPPARNASDVISFYNGISSPTGDQYTNITGVTFDSFGGSTIVGDVVLADGNTVVKYTNHLYSGIGGGSYNVSNMTMLHIDVYSPDFTGFAIKLEANNGSNVELPVPGGTPTQGAWISYDIDLSAYSAVDLANLKWIVPVSFQPPGRTLYIDNVYFWRPAVDPTTDATLSDLKVDGNTINGFLASKINYTLKVPSGTVTVPQITAATTTQAGASRVITQATGIPGNATVLVTASDGLTTKTYTIEIVEVGPSSAAPIQPARAPADVIAIVSDPPYTNETPTGVQTFAGATITNYTVTNTDDTRLLTANPGGGAQFGYFASTSSGFNLTDFTTLHIDLWLEDAGLEGSVLTLQLQNFDSATGAFQHNIFTNLNVNALGAGAWVGGDIDLSTFTNSGLSKNNIQQIQLILAGPAYGPVYFTNFYFHKGTTLGTQQFEVASFNVSPNPTQDSWNIKSKNIKMASIKVYDILGNNVLSFTPNFHEATIDGSSLKTGLYFAKVETENGTDTIKLVKR